MLTQNHALTEEQKHMYASEKLMNFRWVFKVLATHSRRALTNNDLVESLRSARLTEFCQFAEVVYSVVPLNFVFDSDKLSILLQPDFPLEGYNALHGSVCLSTLKGSVGRLPVLIAYRKTEKQLVVAISGTSSLKQGFYDLQVVKCRHPSGHGSVHFGFWSLYEGIKSPTIDAIKKHLQEQDVDEIVVTGHSMGGSLSYLLCLDLITTACLPQPGLKITLAVFGAPRSGDVELVNHWAKSKEDFNNSGRGSIEEYSVKAYNDGVPALPPLLLGYHHFAKEPWYLIQGRLYKIPATESEHAWFPILSEKNDDAISPGYPLGGHNYYGGRDMEKFIRRMTQLNDVNYQEEGWEMRYRSHVE